MGEKIPISVAVITKNEEGNIGACLASAPFARQLVVVDSGSADATVKIAKEAGAEVFVHPWRGFGPQKQFALDQCRESWIMILDADERIPPETQRVIRQIVRENDQAISGFSFPRKNLFQERWIRHAGWWPDRVVRLFRRGSGGVTDVAVHEAVVVAGAVQDLSCPIEHLVESRLSEIIRKMDHYSTLGAREAFRQGRAATIPSALLRAVVTFFHGYVLRLGFLDGAPGLTLAVTDGINKFFKYAKLAELTRRKEQP